ncbi:MAG: CehA/McbA family metallohydrolase [Myxococcota bacterium]|nr:CehA/McbA family metallohydrolase [Myxococcota bacterium]
MRSRRAIVAVALVVIAAAAVVVGWRLRTARKISRSTTTLVLHVTDRGAPVGARVLLFAADGEPVRVGNLDLYGRRQGASACPIAPGVVASWNGLIVARGTGEVPIGGDACRPSPAIPYGRYKVWAWRGIEYERWEGEIDLRAERGRVELAIPLVRAWTLHGTLAADLHVHAEASNDSTVPNPQRVIAQAAAGVQVIGLSDHNTNGDLDLEIEQLGLEDVVASIASNELTSEQLHVNVYPVPVNRSVPRGGAPPADSLVRANAEQLFAAARAIPGNPIVQLNHPRFRVTALYDGTAWNGVTWPPPFPTTFDAVEVLAGYSAFNAGDDRRFDEGARDYFTFVDHGHLLAPLGNSDTHDLNWVLDGTTRSYVYVDDPRTRPFDEAGFIAALRAHRVVATSGPWLDVEVASAQGEAATVGPGESVRAKAGKVWVDVELSQARFVHAERVRIVVGTSVGPQAMQTLTFPKDQTSYRWSGALDVGTTDTWIAITADGDTPLPAEITGTYQQDRWKRPGVTAFAIAAAILVDVDGDGRWKRGDADLVLAPP